MGIKLTDIFSGIPLPFGKREKLCVGIDIGSHAVKICQLARAGRGYRLQSLGSAILPDGAVEDGVLQDTKAVGGVIAALLKNLRIVEKQIGISISGYSVIVKKVNLAVMSSDEMAKHIKTEAEQYIPFDVNDVYLDFQDLKTSSGGDERTDVMLVAAKKEVVDGYLEMLRGIALKPVLVDVDAFALENAYWANAGKVGNVALIDVGASKMNVNIISRGSSVYARDIVLGSRQITEQIENQFHLENEEAEKLKTGKTSANERQEDLEEIFTGICSQWLREIRKALDYYHSNYPDEELEKLVLSGGGSKIKGFDQFLADELNMEVEVFNPFANMTFDRSKIDPSYLAYVGPEMALATGLASRPIEF
jgi:type IV pilus assembly protein PilM